LQVLWGSMRVGPPLFSVTSNLFWIVMEKTFTPGSDVIVLNLPAIGVTHIVATTDNAFVQSQIVETSRIRLSFQAISTERWYKGRKVFPP